VLVGDAEAVAVSVLDVDAMSVVDELGVAVGERVAEGV
jgi:hypothetical protein